MQDKTLLSRREVLAAGAVLASAAAVKPALAQAGSSESSQAVLITGTSSGFGRLMAETFARDGLRVVATMREIAGRNAQAAAELRDVARRDRLAIDVVEIDVTDPASVDSGVAEALRLAGRIDVLVNNAGMIVPGPVELQPIGAIDANFETNINGSLRVFRALAPQMRERGRGYLVQMSSALGRIVLPGNGAYCASKAALEAAIDTIGIENQAFGIETTIIQPAGAYPTRFSENGLRYFDEMLASLPESERPRLAAFEAQIAATRNELAGDPSLNPQEIADGILRVIRMEHGTRPERLVIGPYTEAVEGLNKVHADVQAMLASH